MNHRKDRSLVHINASATIPTIYAPYHNSGILARVTIQFGDLPRYRLRQPVLDSATPARHGVGGKSSLELIAHGCERERFSCMRTSLGPSRPVQVPSVLLGTE
jgi:hypothetical protein